MGCVVESVALTDIGRRRNTNEDRFRLDSDSRLFILADGIGGQVAGSLAAETAVSTIHDFLRLFEIASVKLIWPFGYEPTIPFEHNALRTAFRIANQRVLELARERSCWGMGTTAVATWIRNCNVYFAHVGDNRLYLFRNNRLELLTRDHRLIGEQFRRSLITAEQAGAPPVRHVVTCAIGSCDCFAADIDSLPLLDGDLLLLCSDGLTDQVSSEKLREIFRKGEELETMCRRMVAAANDAGGNDDVTVIMLRHRQD